LLDTKSRSVKEGLKLSIRIAIHRKGPSKAIRRRLDRLHQRHGEGEG